MSRILVGGMLTTGAFMVTTTDPAVQVLEQELMKTLPMIAGAKAQMESMIGVGVGPGWILAALAIVFCGRQVMSLLTKAFDMWADERKENRAEAREDRAWKRQMERGRHHAVGPPAAPTPTTGPAAGVSG